MNPRSSHRLRRSLLAGVIIVLVFSFLVIGLGVTYVVARHELASWRSRVREAQTSAAQRVTVFLSQSQTTLRWIAGLEPELFASQPTAIDGFLTPESPWLEIMVADAAGVRLALTREGRTLGALAAVEAAEWFQATAQGRDYISAPVFPTDGPAYLVLAVPRPQGGAVAGRLRLTGLATLVLNVGLGETGEVYLVEGGGRVIAHTDPGQEGASLSGRPEWDAARAQNVWEGVYTGLTGARVVGAAGVIAPLGWRAFAEVDESAALSAVNELGLWFSLSLAAFGVVVTLATVRWLERLIFTPIQQLRAGVEQFAHGQFTQRLALASDNEIGEVAEAFNALVVRLRNRDAQVAERTDDLTQSNSALYDEIRERVRVEEALRRQNAYLAALHETTLGLMNRLDTQELLGALVARAALLMGTAHGFIYLVTADRRELERKVGIGLFQAEQAPRLQFGEGLSGEVWKSGRPLVVNDYPAWPGRASVTSALRVQSIVGVPLYSAGEVIGVLAVAHELGSDRVFEAQEAESLGRFAQLAAVALDNAQLYAAAQQELAVRQRAEITLRQQNGYLAALHETTLGLMNRLDLNELLQVLVVRAGELLGTPHGFVYLRSPDGAVMERRVGVGIFHEDRVPRVARGYGVTGQVWDTGEPLVINDYPRWAGRPEAIQPGLVQAMMGVPLRSGAEVVGVLAVASEGGSPHTFDASELELLSRFAQLASVALDNAALFSEVRARAAELERLNAVAHEIGLSLEPAVVFEQLARHLAQLLGATSAYFLEINPEANTLTVLAEHWEPEAGELERAADRGRTYRLGDYPTLVGATVSGQAVHWHTESAHQSPAEQAELRAYGIQTALFVPIVAQARVRGGVLIWESRRPRAYGPGELRLAQTIVQQAAGVIENARLYAEARQRVAELATINGIGQALASELGLEAMMGMVGEKIRDLFQAPYVYVALHDAEHQAFRFPYYWEVDHLVRWEAPQPLGAGLTARILETRAPQLINADWEARARELGALHLAPPLPKASLGVPILAGEAVLGVISVQTTEREHFFTEADVRLLTTIAANVGVAIGRARLYDQTQRQKEYFEALVQYSPVAIVTTDRAAQVVAWNPAAETLFGFAAAEALGRPLDDLIARLPDLQADASAISTNTVRGESFHAMTRRTRKDGSLVEVELFSVPVVVGGQLLGLVAIYHDITELQRARREAEAANASKSAFLSSVSHELRTPLTSVLGFARLIQRRLDERVFPAVAAPDERTRRAMQQVADNLHIILVEGERLTSLINDVLDLAKIEAGRVEWVSEPVALGEVIQRAMAATAALFEHKRLPVQAVVAPALPLVLGDRDRLIQVLVNLLSNAVKFTDQGGVTCQARPTAEGVEVTVTDTGIGIAVEDQAAVFEKFKQVGNALTAKPTGTGLGLAICQEIIAHHGGRIWVTSAPGVGSTFGFTLPVGGRPAAER